MMLKEDLIEANKIALRYFCNCLKNSDKACNYLYDRISKKTAKALRIGYAPVLRGALQEQLNDEIGYEVGLLNKKDSNYYEFFNDRIMFPILNNKMIVGFSGRTLKDDKIKYLNTKATKLFNKSEILYVLDVAKKTIYDKNFAILVEGQFDVLTLIDYSVNNVVGVSGTAFKVGHARLIKRWAKNVLILFDADSAGRKAAVKAKKILKKEGMKSKIHELPDGHDAASYVKEFGAEKFRRIE